MLIVIHLLLQYHQTIALNPPNCQYAVAEGGGLSPQFLTSPISIGYNSSLSFPHSWAYRAVFIVHIVILRRTGEIFIPPEQVRNKRA